MVGVLRRLAAWACLCGVAGIAFEWEGVAEGLPRSGMGVAVLGGGGGAAGAALVEALRRSLAVVVVTAVDRGALVSAPCGEAGVYCFLGSLDRVPLLREAFAIAASVDGWDLATGSGDAHVAALRGLLRPGGRVLVAQGDSPPGGALACWLGSLRRAGLADATRAAGAPATWTAVRRGELIEDAPGAPAASSVVGVVFPACEVAQGGAVLRTLAGARDPSASLYERKFHGEDPSVVAVFDAAVRGWSCEQEAVDRALLGLVAPAFEAAATLPRYFSTFSEHVGRLIPARAARVLDVGCGAGLLLKGVKEARRPGDPPLVAEGVEPDAFAVLAARQSLDAVYHGTAENVAHLLPDDAYDAIVFSDVLEHAPRPDVLLRLLAPKLRTNGTACVSVPNMRFWSEFVGPLLDGSWDYAPHGVLDRTHLRWFTLPSFLKMAKAAGFVQDGSPLRLHFGDDHRAPLPILEAVAATLGVDAANALYEESDVRQFLVPLRKAPAPEGPETSRGEL